MALKNNKSLGQNWLRDREALAHIADCADLNKEDVVLEIGPGLGTLTSELLRRVKEVIAVEFDHVDHTGEIAEGGKRFKIIKEESSSAGVRRIKAILA